jgi:hypothetical protein
MIDLEELAQASNLIFPEHLPSFLQDLKRLPNYSWLLTAPHSEESRLQGDILSEFGIALLGPNGGVRLRSLSVLVLNNTCDLQPGRSRFVTVAPVADFNRFAAAVTQRVGIPRAQSYLHDVRSNRVFELLWLPPFERFAQGGIVYLDQLSSASITLYEKALEEKGRLASFSQNGFYYLLLRLTTHLARPESRDIRRYIRTEE